MLAVLRWLVLWLALGLVLGGGLLVALELHALRQTVRGLRSDVDTLAEYLLRCVTISERVARALDRGRVAS